MWCNPCILSQARARLELRELVTAKDAQHVVEIMKFRYMYTCVCVYMYYVCTCTCTLPPSLSLSLPFSLSGCSMYETFSDEFGMLDFERSQHGSGMSQRSQVTQHTDAQLTVCTVQVHNYTLHKVYNRYPVRQCCPFHSRLKGWFES